MIYSRKDFYHISNASLDAMQKLAPGAVNVHTTPDGKTAYLDIDGYVGRDELAEQTSGTEPENTAKIIKARLREITAPHIVVMINSLGGNIDDCLAIMNLLRAKNADITTYVVGFTAGPALMIAQGGDTRVMAPLAFARFQRASLPLFGYVNSNTLRQHQADLMTLDDVIIERLMKNATMTLNDLEKLLDADRWISSEDALENGLIDKVARIDEVKQEGDATNSRRSARRNNTRREQTRATADTSVPESIPSHELRLIAHHEASHAVIARALGNDVSQLRAGWDDQQSSKGTCDVNYKEGLESWESLAICLAGPLSDFIYRNGDHRIYDFDYGCIQRASNTDGLSDSDRVELILESETPAQAKEVWDKALSYTQSRILRNCQYRRNLANELCRRGNMNSDQITSWFNKQEQFDRFYS